MRWPYCAPAPSIWGNCAPNLSNISITDLNGLVIDGYEEEAKPTAGFQRVLQRAVIHVQSAGREEVTGANVLVSLFSERESHAVYFLQGAEYDALRRGQLHLARHHQIRRRRPERADRRGRTQTTAKSRKNPARLKAIASTSTSKPGRRHRSLDRPHRRSRPHDPNPVPPPEKQSALCRRSGRRQNRDCRRAGAADRAQTKSRKSCAARDFLARYGRCSWRARAIAAISRSALKSVLKELKAIPRRNSVHRRNSYGYRRRRDLLRLHGCVEFAETSARQRLAALHRLDNI